MSRFVYATRVNVPDYLVKGGVDLPDPDRPAGQPAAGRRIRTTGVVAQRMDYDSFGNVLVDTNPGFQPFGFAGGLYDRIPGSFASAPATTMLETGRWTAKDPIGFAGGQTNLYATSTPTRSTVQTRPGCARVTTRNVETDS